MDDKKLVELRALSKVASPGPWSKVTDYPSIAIASGQYRVVQTPNQNNYQHYGPAQPWLGVGSDTNADFIAACDPQVIIALLDEIDRLRARNAELEAAAMTAECEGLEKAARSVDKRLDDYIREYGMYDSTTGVTEYSGDGEEYTFDLEEIAKGIRTLKSQQETPNDT